VLIHGVFVFTLTRYSHKVRKLLNATAVNTQWVAGSRFTRIVGNKQVNLKNLLDSPNTDSNDFSSSKLF
jgi:hypothetical protein